MRIGCLTKAGALALLAFHAVGCSAFDWSESRIVEKWERKYARSAARRNPSRDGRMTERTDADFTKAGVAILVSGARELRVVTQGNKADVRSKATGWGTATAVSEDGYFLTARHSIGADPLTLICWDRREGLLAAPARVIWQGDSETSDLALLHARVQVLRVRAVRSILAHPRPARVGRRLRPVQVALFRRRRGG